MGDSLVVAPSADDRDPNFKQQGRDADIYACDLGAHAVCQLDPVRVANWRDIAEQALRNVDPFSACMHALRVSNENEAAEALELMMLNPTHDRFTLQIQKTRQSMPSDRKKRILGALYQN